MLPRLGGSRRPRREAAGGGEGKNFIQVFLADESADTVSENKCYQAVLANHYSVVIKDNKKERFLFGLPSTVSSSNPTIPWIDFT